MNFTIRAGTSADAPEILALLPRLADFDLPQHRTPEHLWHGDRSMIEQWALGDRPEVDIAVAVNDALIVGIAVISAKQEIFSGEPSVHLETLAVGTNSQGYGIGAALMRETETMASRRGAKSISLHVFSANTRARALYERHGYCGELMRYYKPLNRQL